MPAYRGHHEYTDCRVEYGKSIAKGTQAWRSTGVCETEDVAVTRKNVSMSNRQLECTPKGRERHMRMKWRGT